MNDSDIETNDTHPKGESESSENENTRGSLADVEPSDDETWISRMKTNVTTYRDKKQTDPPATNQHQNPPATNQHQNPQILNSAALFYSPQRNLSVNHIRNIFVLRSFLCDTIPVDSRIYIETTGHMKSYTGSINSLADQVNYSSKVYIEYEGKTHMLCMIPSLNERSILMITCS